MNRTSPITSKQVRIEFERTSPLMSKQVRIEFDQNLTANKNMGEEGVLKEHDSHGQTGEV